MYLAHTANKLGKAQSLREHLLGVAKKASHYAEPLRMQEEAFIAGLLHDLGKYADSFQARLRGEKHGIDHWSPGAAAALTKCHAIAAALAVQGHHIGLQCGDEHALRSIARLDIVAPNRSLRLDLSESDTKKLLARLANDGLSVPSVTNRILGENVGETASSMLDVRMLYSALVDADFIDTEAHMAEGTSRVPRPRAPDLNPERAFELLDQYVRALQEVSDSEPDIGQLRRDLYYACAAAGELDPGIFTLTAPTGSGKTLAMLAFALRHASKHNLRRIVVVIPYLSIIEQTADVYRRLFEKEFGSHYVLEHHSLAHGVGMDRDLAGQDLDGDNPRHIESGLLAENWDAPLIVTTSVQMLESLFSNRPSACRKLHRLARSVILFDEVQTLPHWLAVATLATLNRLAERYSSTIVFATATQPAFTHLDQKVRELDGPSSGWTPREIVFSELRLFQRSAKAKSLEVKWPEANRRWTWPDLADELHQYPQALCIVNLKRHARELFLEAKSRREDVWHLSTSMCPAHRSAVLKEVKKRLKGGESCLLISTQCVEAGVDLDAPVVYRAFADFTSITQAAGRCNREGRRSSGRVVIFYPEDERYPDDGAYKQAADVTKALLKGASGSIDIDDPGTCLSYYRALYNLASPHDTKKTQEMRDAIKRQDFAGVAELYKLIRKDAINILVPYPEAMDEFEQLAKRAREEGLSSEWIRLARPLTVSIYRPSESAEIWGRLEPIPLRRDRSAKADDWFIYCAREDYDSDCGLIPPEAAAVLIA